jgi:hypothetical protein
MKKGNILFVVFFFAFACLKEEAAAETVEEPFFSNEKIESGDDFSGDYFFSSIDMKEIDESEYIDLCSYENLNESIYIKIVKIDSDKYKMESNFWLLMEQINSETVYGFPYRQSTDEFMPPLIHEAPSLNRKTDLQIHCHDNYIVIDYSYKDSRLERVQIIETTDMIIGSEGSVTTSTTTTRRPSYSPDKVMLKCKIFFQKLDYKRGFLFVNPDSPPYPRLRLVYPAG